MRPCLIKKEKKKKVKMEEGGRAGESRGEERRQKKMLTETPDIGFTIPYWIVCRLTELDGEWTLTKINTKGHFQNQKNCAEGIKVTGVQVIECFPA